MHAILYMLFLTVCITCNSAYSQKNPQIRKECLMFDLNKVCVNFSLILIDYVSLIGSDNKPITPE